MYISVTCKIKSYPVKFLLSSLLTQKYYIIRTISIGKPKKTNTCSKGRPSSNIVATDTTASTVSGTSPTSSTTSPNYATDTTADIDSTLNYS